MRILNNASIRFCISQGPVLTFRTWTSEAWKTPRLNKITSIMQWNGNTCKAACSAKIEIARLAEGFPSYLPEQFALHLRFRVAIAGRVIIRTQVHFSRVILPHTFATPGETSPSGNRIFCMATRVSALQFLFPTFYFSFPNSFARLRSRPPLSPLAIPPAWFPYASVICNINWYSRLLSPAPRGSSW